MAHTDDDDLIVGRFIENQIGIGRGDDAPKTRSAGALTAEWMLQQEHSDLLNAQMHTPCTLRRPLGNVSQNLVQFGER